MDNILILAAMPQEVEFLRDALHKQCYSYEKYDNNYFEYRMCDSIYDPLSKRRASMSDTVGILITGVGMLNSINKIVRFNNQGWLGRFSKIINIGTCGARGSYKVGDIVKISTCYNGDFDLSVFGYDKYEIPGSLGKYLTLDEGDVKCITVSRFFTDSNTVVGMSNYVVDMELYGIASLLSTIGCSSLESYKIVTDSSDGDGAKDEHEANLDDLAKDLCSYIYDKISKEG